MLTAAVRRAKPDWIALRMDDLPTPLCPTITDSRSDNSDFKEDDLSENVVYQMAELLANKKKANWILVVGSVSKDKDESESVWIAVGSIKKGFITRKIGVRKGRRLRQDRLVTHALDLLRKELLEYSPRK